MLLQPRTFTYKRRQKQRKCLTFNNNFFNKLNFGSAGLMILTPIHLTANQLYRFKLYLKRASKKSESTKRFV